jgi:SAM-dependent methyltransferase
MFEDWYLNELFSNKIRNVWKLTDYYLLKLIFVILEETDIISLLKKAVSINEILDEKKYPLKVFNAVKWMLDRLAMDEYLKITDVDSINKYTLTDKVMDYNLNEIKNQAVSMAPDSIAAFNMLKLIAENYPLYLSGKKTGIDIIFSYDNIEITNDYYSNNLFYNTHNIAGAKIVNWDIQQRDNPKILEVGGGLGGGTKQFVIQKLINDKSTSNFQYYFTDIANKMLRTTKKSLLTIIDDLSSFNFQKLDFNKDLLSQGYGENSFDVIWGVNAAHVAHDLRFTLTEFYKTLKPGGSLIISETVRPVGNKMIQQELLLNTIDDYWNVKIDKEIRPTHGFIDWTLWISALKTIGFDDVKTIPDMKILQEEYDNCYIAVIRGVKKQ